MVGTLRFAHPTQSELKSPACLRTSADGGSATVETTSLRGATRRSNPSLGSRRHGLLRRACHRRAFARPVGSQWEANPHHSHAHFARRVNLSHPHTLAPSGKSVALICASRTHKRGVSRSSRTLGAGCGGRLGCSARDRRADESILADGEIVWS